MAGLGDLGLDLDLEERDISHVAYGDETTVAVAL